MPDQLPPVACTLTTKRATRQLLEWEDLRGNAHQIMRVSGGMAMTLPADMAERIEDLAEREAACCAFLTIRVGEVEEARIELRITSTNPDARPVIELIAGSPVKVALPRNDSCRTGSAQSARTVPRGSPPSAR